MTVSEQQRYEMSLGLRRLLGDDVANTVMEHLPPSGWSDVARLRDIELVRSEVHAVAEQVSQMRSTLRVLIGAVLTVSMALITMLIQLQSTISGL